MMMKRKRRRGEERERSRLTGKRGGKRVGGRGREERRSAIYSLLNFLGHMFIILLFYLIVNKKINLYMIVY